MNQSSFWSGRPVLVVGCTGFLGTWVVRKLVEHGASVVGLVRNSHRRSELFAGRQYENIHVARGAADASRLRGLLAVQRPSVVFQLAAVPDVAHSKSVITANLLRAGADQSPGPAVVVPLSPADPQPIFRNAAGGQLRVGFVRLPSLFGPGDVRPVGWAARLFRAAARRQPLPPVEADMRLTFAPEAALSLLAAAELLATLPVAPEHGLTLEPPATTTARQLHERVASPIGVAGHRLGDAVRQTLAWYEQQPAHDTDVALRRAA